MSTPSKEAQAAVQAVLADFTDRRGLRQAWEGVDVDIRKEIEERWAELIDHAFDLPLHK